MLSCCTNKHHTSHAQNWSICLMSTRQVWLMDCMSSAENVHLYSKLHLCFPPINEVNFLVEVLHCTDMLEYLKDMNKCKA